jgi:hypothetical protein
MKLNPKRRKVEPRDWPGDQIAGTTTGVTVRRVIYQDPETGIIYHYLTNLSASAPPGVVALLYKIRWDVEKVFDEFKNKLMTLMEQTIEKCCGLRNEAEFKRREKRQAEKSTPLPATRLATQRLIVHKTPGSLLLCYVDLHDRPTTGRNARRSE